MRHRLHIHSITAAIAPGLKVSGLGTSPLALAELSNKVKYPTGGNLSGGQSIVIASS